MRLSFLAIGLCSLTTCLGLVSDCAAQQDDSANSAVARNAPPELRRFALLIGTAHYDYAEPLPNVETDAAEIKTKLVQLGFLPSDIVPLPDPQDDNAILASTQDLANRAGGPDEPAIILFYFAGHGFQNGPYPYLVPKGARPDHYIEDSVPLDKIMHQLARKQQAGLVIIILDACRTGVPPDTPQPPDLQALAFSATESQSSEVMHLSTELGTPAASIAYVGDSESPYTQALLRNVGQPGLSLDRILELVSNDVITFSGEKQSSVTYKEANISQFYLLPTDRQLGTENASWETASESNRRECVRDYIRDHPGSRYLKPALKLLNSGTLDVSRGDRCPGD
jgi:hypothetical protein